MVTLEETRQNQPAKYPIFEQVLTPRQEIALLARILDREDFNTRYVDALSGHITWRQPDDTVLVNPWGIPWSELRASDLVTADLKGNQIDGSVRVHPGALLHFALHQSRHVEVTVHNHPRWATIWADHHRLPPIYDQTSAKVSGRLALVHEYEGVVKFADVSARVIDEMGDADAALLAHHGVLVTGSSVPDVMLRCLALEARSRNAWHVEALGGQAPELPEHARAAVTQGSDDEGIARATYLALVRREIRLDSSVLD
jgi:ribulose-5-phosphate 4-epimerase/fuculose-1-phosphate aldolase